MGTQELSLAVVVQGPRDETYISDIKPLLSLCREYLIHIKLFMVFTDPLKIWSRTRWARWAWEKKFFGLIYWNRTRTEGFASRPPDEPFPVFDFSVFPGGPRNPRALESLRNYMELRSTMVAPEDWEEEIIHLYLVPSQQIDQHFGRWIRLPGTPDALDTVPTLLDALGVPLTPSQPEISILPLKQEATEDLTKLQNLIQEQEITIRRLSRSEKRYRKFFEDDITGDFVMGLDWRIIDCNRSFARIFGFPSVDYALGYDGRQLFTSKADRQKAFKQFRVLQTLDYYEMELVRPDGHQVWVIANILGIKNDEGQLVQIRGFLFDNTPRKNLEIQLRESQKMEGLGRLAGGVAHDFNNLLTVINGYSELLMAELPQNSSFQTDVREILHAGLRASELTSQLLAFSRRQVISPKVLELNKVVSSMETMLQRLLNERVKLVLDLDPALPTLTADKGQLEQVIMNLVLNARDAMAEGGLLTVKTRVVLVETSYYTTQELILPGIYAELVVSDTGGGMDEETQKMIFEPFFTTKKQGKGTGLGLAMVYGIVQQSGGTLRLTSTLGKGTSFSILFPGNSPLVQEGNLQVEELSAPRGDREKIILVEDEDMVREYALRILSRYGYRVQAFHNGQEALNFLINNPNEGQLILTDVVMPVMTGQELVEALQTRGINLPVIFFSGYTDDEIVRHGVFTKKVNFVHKPFKSQILLKQVREVLDLHFQSINS